MLKAVETYGRVQTAAYWRLPKRMGYMSLATHVKGGESMRARPDTKPGSTWSGEGLQSAMQCSSKMSRKYFDLAKEIVRGDMSRVMRMPRSWDTAPKSLILNRVPSRALNEVNKAVSPQAAGMSSTYFAIIAKTEPVRKM
jgi:hypothetical protein